MRNDDEGQPTFDSDMESDLQRTLHQGAMIINYASLSFHLFVCSSETLARSLEILVGARS